MRERAQRQTAGSRCEEIMIVHQSARADGNATHVDRRSPHSVADRLRRFIWGIVYVLCFRTSPRNLHRWRNWVLRMFGGQLHSSARVYPRARVWAPWNLVMHHGACLADDVDCYCVATITIGANSTVSQYSYLCAATHDYEDPRHPLVPKPITIGQRCWIAADVFVGPGVTIGDGTVVYARASVVKDLPEWIVARGTPAEPFKERRLGDKEGSCDD